MADTETKKEPTPAELEKKDAGTAAPKKIIVKASADVDFPGLGWGISKDTQRELPDDSAAQAAILANANVTLVTK